MLRIDRHLIRDQQVKKAYLGKYGHAYLYLAIMGIPGLGNLHDPVIPAAQQATSKWSMAIPQSRR
ncbi:MAG: hypothetical protein ACOYET_04690, partial [Bacillota bacterium]